MWIPAENRRHCVASGSSSEWHETVGSPGLVVAVVRGARVVAGRRGEPELPGKPRDEIRQERGVASRHRGRLQRRPETQRQVADVGGVDRHPPLADGRVVHRMLDVEGLPGAARRGAHERVVEVRWGRSGAIRADQREGHAIVAIRQVQRDPQPTAGLGDLDRGREGASWTGEEHGLTIHAVPDPQGPEVLARSVRAGRAGRALAGTLADAEPTADGVGLDGVDPHPSTSAATMTTTQPRRRAMAID